MRKFDGKDPVNWILQMEKYFDLHGVPLLQKVCIASSYLEPDQFLWYKGLCSRKKLVTWSILTEEMIAHYEGTKSNTFFRARPQQLERVKGLCDILESKIMATTKSTPHNYKYGSVVSPSLPQPTRVTPQQLEEKREKGLCYNCDGKCTKGHKCAENKLFYIEYEEEKEKDQETTKEEDMHQDPTVEKEAMNQTISCEALARITTPQTLKIEGHIKKKKVQEVKYHTEKEEMNPTISYNSLVEIITPQTIKIEGHIKKKNVQEVKDHIEHQEMNPTISCKGLEEITTPQTLEIEGHVKKKKIQAVKDHIKHQQQVLQILKDNDTSVQNQMKQQVDQHCSEKNVLIGYFYCYISSKLFMRRKCWQYYMHLKNGNLTEWEDSSRMRIWKHCFVLFLLSNQIG